MSKTGPKDNYKMTDDAVRKLEEAFAIDASIEEACYYADISRDTYYRWVKENSELSDKFQRLRNKPILKARQAVVKGLDNYANAMDYLKRKRKDEFSDRSEITGKDGKDLPTPILNINVQSDDSDKQDNSAEQED